MDGRDHVAVDLAPPRLESASFKPGDKVKLEGMPSLDGTFLMRITRAYREDGTEIGVPPGTNN